MRRRRRTRSERPSPTHFGHWIAYVVRPVSQVGPVATMPRGDRRNGKPGFEQDHFSTIVRKQQLTGPDRFQDEAICFIGDHYEANSGVNASPRALRHRGHRARDRRFGIRLIVARPVRQLVPARAAAAAAAGRTAQSSGSDLVVRLDRLENTIRQLTGTLEQLQYRNQQLEQQLKRMQDDTEYRFRNWVARGASVPPSAGTGAAMPSVPQRRERAASSRRARKRRRPRAAVTPSTRRRTRARPACRARSGRRPRTNRRSACRAAAKPVRRSISARWRQGAAARMRRDRSRRSSRPRHRPGFVRAGLWLCRAQGLRSPRTPCARS